MNKRYRFLAMGAIVLAFVILNVVVPRFFWRTSPGDLDFYVNFFFIGGLISEAALLATWAAFGPQRAVVRIPVTVVLLGLGTCSYILGLKLLDDGLPADVIVVMFGAAVLMYGAMQLPLWVVRSRWQRRIVTRESGELATNRESSQFGLRHLLLWTTLISAALVLAKYCMPSGAFERGTPWGAILLVLGVCATFATLIGLPCIWLALAERNRTPWLLWLLVAGLLGPMVVVAILVAGLGGPGSLTEFTIAMYCLGGGAASCMLATLLLCRLMGYRLLGPGDRIEQRDGDVRPSLDSHSDTETRSWIHNSP